MKKLSLFLALFMLFGLLFAGCSASDTPDTPDTPDDSDSSVQNTPDDTPDTSKRTDLNIAVGEAAGTLDPHYSALLVEGLLEKQIYEPLIRIVDDGQEVPVLATDYTVSDDGLVYTFSLRPDVKFHNGETLKASDVVFSFERARQSPYRYSSTEAIASVAAPDDSTFVMTLSRVYSPIIQYLDGIYIINEKQFNEVGNDAFGLTPCGTGPYTLTGFQAAVSANMEAFPDYWGGQAPIQELNWKVITDASTRLIAFESGEIDYVGIPTANWDEIRQNEKYATEAVSDANVAFMMMNHEIEPFNNKLVRQALSCAINKDDIGLMALDGLAVSAPALANPELVSGMPADFVSFSYDPEKAKELLAEAGFPDGFDAGVIKITSGLMEKIAQVIQSNLAAVGVTTTIEVVELTTYSTDLSNGNYTMGLTAATIGYDLSMYSIAYTSATIGSFNFARYNNPEVDTLFAQALSTVDTDARNKVYAQLLDIIQEDAVYIPILYPAGGNAYHKDLNYVSGRGHTFYEWSWN